MKTIISFLVLATSALLSMPATATADCHELLDYSATKLRSTEKIEFCQRFSGKALLVVNTASQCGFTPQFKDLEKLHQQYGDKLAIIGFPSNDFKQEHSDSEKVADVCYVNYGVTFTMLEPSSVRGENANKLFKMLSQKTGKQPGWNFNKYLVSADGQTVKHFASDVEPMSKEIRSEVDRVLAIP
ncbi:MAG: glutathione peroxidase [Arenicella sp.]|nr:glutathione peroxidase [Arenicella sp.]